MTRLATLPLALVLLTALALGCAGDPPEQPRGPDGISVLGADDRASEQERAERARRDTTWRAHRGGDAPAGQRDPRPAPLDPAIIDRYVEALAVPLAGDTTRLAIYHAQVLLDRAGFSPGEIDGRWGQNTEKALHWLQRREGIDATGTLDRATLTALAPLADAPNDPSSLTRSYTISADDLERPFTELPDDPYDQAELDWLGYESMAEKLGEKFHISPGMLAELNPDTDFYSLSAGDTISVPDVGADRRPGAGSVDHLVVSDGGRYLHAVDASGEIVYHFPATLGSDYEPSPRETLTVESIHEEPWWHFQPAILADYDDDDEEAMIPPGPNSAVGLVWIALSKQHYGIHGTRAPGSIGYTTSAGCVRLTNWDALFLAEHVAEGMTVEFRDVER